MIQRTCQCVFCLAILYGVFQKQAVAQEIIPVSLRWLTTEGPVNAVRCLPGGREVAVGSVTQGWTEILQIWDVEKRRVVHGSKEGDSEIESISIDAKGTRLAALELFSNVFLWDLTRWKRLQGPVIDKTDSVYLICLQTTGENLAVVLRDQGLRIWDVTAGKWKVTQATPPPEISALFYEQKLWVGTETGEIWEYQEDRWQQLLAAPHPPTEVVTLQMANLADEQRLFVLTHDGVIRWISEGRVAGRVLLDDRLGKPVAMAVHSSGKRLVTVTLRGQLRFWNILTNSAEPVGQVDCYDGIPPDPKYRITDLSIDNTSGIIAVASSAGGVRLFRSDWWRGGP